MHCYPQVSALAFHRFMSSGRTSPALFSCSDGGSELVEYVVKFQGRIASGVVSELIACELGGLLGIPVAAGAIVSIDPRLTTAAPQLVEVLDSSGGPHFGSRHHTGGYSVFSGTYSIPRDSMPVAIDVFAWDMLLQNPDRRKGNPNLLFNGSQFVVIDHELACAFESFIGGVDPFRLRGTQLEKEHVLRFALLPQITATSFDGFVTKLAGISPSRVEDMLLAIPPTWAYPRRIDAILTHFEAVLTDVDQFRQGLLEIFA